MSEWRRGSFICRTLRTALHGPLRSSLSVLSVVLHEGLSPVLSMSLPLKKCRAQEATSTEPNDVHSIAEQSFGHRSTTTTTSTTTIVAAAAAAAASAAATTTTIRITMQQSQEQQQREEGGNNKIIKFLSNASLLLSQGFLRTSGSLVSSFGWLRTAGRLVGRSFVLSFGRLLYSPFQRRLRTSSAQLFASLRPDKILDCQPSNRLRNTDVPDWKYRCLSSDKR